jgi:type IV pilus assembly protein PilB
MAIATGYPAELPVPHRHEPLGQILKQMEVVSEGQIQQALGIQKERGGLIGEILIDLDIVSRDEVLIALAVQKGAEV